MSDDKCQCDIPEDECGFPECRAACDRVRAADEITTLRAEITRLENALRYEQHRAERIGTHGPGCEMWGPQHYECAVRKLAASEARVKYWIQRTAGAWEICASAHRAYAEKTDPFFTTRQADFMKHAADARAALAEREAG